MTKKILVIDDSALMRRVISDIINISNEYEVAAIARDGLEGFDLIVSNPNLYAAVILDINMPKMNGLELLERLQKNRINQTVIVVSTVAKSGAKETIRALELGAFDFVTKPENYLETKSETFRIKIHNMLDLATGCNNRRLQSDLMSTSKNTESQPIKKSTTASERTLTGTVRKSFESTASGTVANKATRTFGTESKSVQSGTSASSLRRTSLKDNTNQNVTGNARMYAQTSRTTESQSASARMDPSSIGRIRPGRTKLVALACSTGGPKSLQQVIPQLPKELDAAVVLVQHMPKGFTASLAQRLDEISNVKVKEAEEGDVITKGHVYIAPGGMHMRVVSNGTNHIIKLSDEPAIDGLRPCANLMYESLAECNYDEYVCVVLTGMGADGTKGIKCLASKNKKIHVISQDENSCVVFGMPKAIIQTGLVDEVVPLDQVAETITKNVGVS